MTLGLSIEGPKRGRGKGGDADDREEFSDYA